MLQDATLQVRGPVSHVRGLMTGAVNSSREMQNSPQLVVEQSGGCLHSAIEVKPHIPVTLVCADTHRPALAEKAIEACLKQCTFDDVVFLTNDESRKHARKIDSLKGIEGYSNLMIRELDKYVTKSSHALVVQWDGYILNAQAWTDDFLKLDYIGSPWQSFNAIGGNGGFSLRSKKLLHILATHPFGDQPHPEDNYICYRHAAELQAMGIKFASRQFANWFSYEGRLWNGNDWYSHPQPWQGQFGFHSFLTKLPEELERPTIFHHSGDMGDVIYSLPVIKQLGGGILWLSPENHYPYPSNTRVRADYDWAGQLVPLLNQQEYITHAQFTPAYSHSADVDLNEFRKPYRNIQNPDCWNSLFRLHLKAFNLDYPEDEPWLTVDRAVEIPGRPIVFSRSPRYHNDSVQLYPLIQKHHEQMVFVGLADEYEAFKMYCLPITDVPHVPCANLLEVARVIAGCKVFIGNQSSPMAIALGLGKNLIQEVWPGNANCVLKRANAIYARSGVVEIPKEWL